VPCKDLGDIHTALKAVMSSLYGWKREHFKSVPREMEKKREQLDILNHLTDDATLARKSVLLKEMDELLYREEIMWMQRSRIAWLREGDKSSCILEKEKRMAYAS
jgi:hypothetical protein